MNDQQKVVAIVGSAHTESLRALEVLRSKRGVAFQLYGNVDKTVQKAGELGIDLKGISMIDTSDDLEACTQAAMAAGEGRVQVLMKGTVHTADFLKGVLDKERDLLPEGSLISHVARLDLPWYHKPLLLTDAAVSILPDMEKKVQIINNALGVANGTGIEIPKVALVCPVETVNPRIVSTTDASQLVFLQKHTEVFPKAIIEGPFGLDVALSKAAADIKGIEGEVPGDADILVFGNIDAANATYKAFLSVPSVTSAGMVVGARIPIVLTSRSETMDTRVASIELALSVSM